MFESTSAVMAVGAVCPPSSADLAAFCTALRGSAPSLDDAARFERIRRLEEAKAAVAAAQAVEVAAFVRSRRAVTAADIAANPVKGVGTRRRLAAAERGIVADVALARRESPAQAAGFIGFALTAPTELPSAFSQLAAGALSERRTRSLHTTTTWLEPEQRQAVDAELAARLLEYGDRQLQTEAQAAAYRIDPAGACARVAAAQNQRHVSLRPAPESMTRFTALLPLVNGVAVWAALDHAARCAAAAGDPRGRGQVMADTLVERVTGQATAPAVPVEVHLVMTDQTLQGTSIEPARIVGGGWIPAGVARDLVLGPDRDTTNGTGKDSHSDTDSQGESAAARSVRRLFTDPAGHLVAMEATTRRFTPAMRHLVRVRDDTCRTPWCDAPIRHIDHIDPAGRAGPTSVTNARGSCAGCNYTAQTPGMTSVAHPTDGSVVTRTPTGQLYRSRPPELPRARPLHTATPVIDIMWGTERDHAA